MFKVRCVRNVNAMVCRDHAQSKHAGCACQTSDWWVTIWKTVSMGHHESWSPTVRMQPARMPFNITIPTAYNRIISHRARTASHRIPFDGIIIDEKIIGKFSQYFEELNFYYFIGWMDWSPNRIFLHNSQFRRIPLIFQIHHFSSLFHQISFPIETIQSRPQSAWRQRPSVFGTIAWILYEKSTIGHSRNERPSM